MLKWLFRFLPIGVFTLFLMIATMNLIWTTAMMTGIEAYDNDSRHISTVHGELDASQQRVLANMSEDPEVDATTRTVFGFSLSEYANTMYRVAHDGVRFGHEYPHVAGVLTRYWIPVLLSVFWYGVIRHETIAGIVGFFKGSIK